MSDADWSYQWIRTPELFTTSAHLSRPNELRKIAWPHRQWVTTHLAERIHDIRQQKDAICFIGELFNDGLRRAAGANRTCQLVASKPGRLSPIVGRSVLGYTTCRGHAKRADFSILGQRPNGCHTVYSKINLTPIMATISSEEARNGT